MDVLLQAAGIPDDSAAETEAIEQQEDAQPEAGGDMTCRRVDLEPGLPEALAAIVAIGASDALLTVGQIVELLQGAASGHVPVSTVPMQNPPAGSMFVFARGHTGYMLDGYTWGKDIPNYRYITSASDGVKRVTAVYAKSTISNIQRRRYMDDGGHVFVHYVTLLCDPSSIPVAGTHRTATSDKRKRPAPAPVAAPRSLPPVPAAAPAAPAVIAAIVHTKALFQTPGTRMGTAIMRLAGITEDASTGRDVCAVAVYLSGSKASDDEKNFHFGEIKAMVLADMWIDALFYIRTVARTL